MKNEKNYVGFLISKVWQILKRFAGTFYQAQTLKFWGVGRMVAVQTKHIGGAHFSMKISGCINQLPPWFSTSWHNHLKGRLRTLNKQSRQQLYTVCWIQFQCRKNIVLMLSLLALAIGGSVISKNWIESSNR